MNNIEKIKAEIERRRLHFNKEAEKYQALNNGYSQNCYGACDALRDLENFLDTLSEKPSKSLEKAAEEYRRESYRKSVLPNIDGPIPEYGGNIKTAFKAGAEWQKNQILKDAVEGYVTFNRDAQIEGLPCVTVIAKEKSLKFYESRGFELGNKVRIVVLKAEEE